MTGRDGNIPTAESLWLKTDAELRQTVDRFCNEANPCAVCGEEIDGYPQHWTADHEPRHDVCPGRDDWPTHQPYAPEAPIPGVHHYGACSDSYAKVRPDGRCEECGEKACPECGQELCPGQCGGRGYTAVKTTDGR